MVKPTVSVVVTCFNRERYLADSIESVLAGRFENFELIVLDDASTDTSVEIAQSYSRADKRVRVVVNRTNLGDYPNRNRALELVTTPFLKYHDSDDIMYAHCLETLVTLLDAEPTAGFALSSGRFWQGGPCPMLLTPRMAYRREYFGGGLFHCGPSGALFRTEVLRGFDGFPARGVASDFLFWLKAAAVTPLLLVPGDLMWYRIHPGQELLGESAARAYAVAFGEGWKALLSPDCPLSGEELALAKRSYVHRLLRVSLRDARRGRLACVRLRFKCAGVRMRDVFRYPPKRIDDPKLGSPLDENDDYVVPTWRSPNRDENPKVHSM